MRQNLLNVFFTIANELKGNTKYIVVPKCLYQMLLKMFCKT